jgi:signal transduction histidine kinase
VPVVLLLTVLLGTISSLVLAEKHKEIDIHLAREANELELLAAKAIDPKTGKSFTSAADLLLLYIGRTIPDPNETMFVVVNGLVSARTTDTPPVRLDKDLPFLGIVQSSSKTTFGNYTSDAGNARYMVVPVVTETDTGALVAIIFSDQDSASIVDLLVRFALISMFSLIGVGTVGWLVAGRVLRPVTELRKTAHAIRVDDLSQRIPVSGGNSELDQLASEFNLMLDRIQEAFKSQQRFVDDAGHELRTPLTIIMGHFDLMDQDPTQTESAMPIIRDELGRMSRLVQDLQTLTKSSSPNFTLLQSSEVSDLASDIEQKAKGLSGRRIQFSSATGLAKLDPQRVTQAVLQLIENAIKHTTVQDQIRVKFELEKDLVITVEDSGAGIPESDVERVFEPFFRSKGQQNLEGSGIGLALVKAIAQAHGGSVEAGKSELGGAKITMRLRGRS